MDIIQMSTADKWFLALRPIPVFMLSFIFFVADTLIISGTPFSPATIFVTAKASLDLLLYIYFFVLVFNAISYRIIYSNRANLYWIPPALLYVFAILCWFLLFVPNHGLTPELLTFSVIAVFLGPVLMLVGAKEYRKRMDAIAAAQPDAPVHKKQFVHKFL